MKFDKRFGILEKKCSYESIRFNVYRDIDMYVAATTGKFPFCGKYHKTLKGAENSFARTLKKFFGSKKEI